MNSKMKQYILDQGYLIQECDEKKIRREARNEVHSVIKKKHTQLEKEILLKELKKSAIEDITNYEVGTAFESEEPYSNDLYKFLDHYSKRHFHFKIPISIKGMQDDQYNELAWYDLLFSIIESVDESRDISYTVYDKMLDRFFRLNKRAYLSYKARIRYEVIQSNIEYLTNAEDPQLYINDWKENPKGKKGQLYKDYVEYITNMSQEEVVLKIFNDLKKQFFLNNFSDEEASDEIKKITDITFFKPGLGLDCANVAKVIRDYKRYLDD